ncbi:hypothetical protein Bca4012_061648 [Brassica carinata]
MPGVGAVTTNPSLSVSRATVEARVKMDASGFVEGDVSASAASPAEPSMWNKC